MAARFILIGIVLSYWFALPTRASAQVVADPARPSIHFAGELLTSPLLLGNLEGGSPDSRFLSPLPSKAETTAVKPAAVTFEICSDEPETCSTPLIPLPEGSPGSEASSGRGPQIANDGHRACGGIAGALSLCSDPDFSNPCAKSHGKLHYLNDFSYLDDPAAPRSCLGDPLKRLGKNSGCGCIGGGAPEDSWLDIGGRFRLRYHNERGLGRQVGSTLLDNNETNHMLLQLRLFGDWHINKQTRVFAEGLYADVAAGDVDYRPRGNERNRGDILNLFVDMKIAENTTVRFGRQQLLYGSRRLIAGPGWANTSRSHDGIKVIQKFGKLRVDSLFMKGVPVAVDDFDETDYDRTLFGTFATYKGTRDTMNAYYLGFDDDRPGNEKLIHTIGAHLQGGGDWLYDIEAAGQFGRQNALGLDHAAAFATVGVGRNLESFPWSPELWGYYDFATGDAGGGAFNRFESLFHRRHHNLGFIDMARRENIEIPSLQLTLNPSKRFKVLTRYYHIMANQETDEIRALGLTAAQNTTSKDYGDTIDVAAYYKISPRSNTRVGYSHFWRGNKITANDDASFVYADWALWF